MKGLQKQLWQRKPRGPSRSIRLHRPAEGKTGRAPGVGACVPGWALGAKQRDRWSPGELATADAVA